MSEFWPSDLIRELSDRRGLIFLGSGASRSCESATGDRLPDWVGLLNKLAGCLGAGELVAYNEMISRSRLLDAAQLIRDSVPNRVVDDLILAIFNDARIRPSKLYDAVNLIDQPVVLTTNYDRMYERFWDELEPDQGGGSPQLMTSTHLEDDIVDHLRAGRRLLIKMHGTATKPRDIVLSRSDYATARTHNAEFYRTVSALMLTRTMLFIGSGFNGDPDIDLLLEDVAFTAKSAYPHYALLPEGRHSSEIKSLRSAFNVEVLEYEVGPGHDHSALVRHLGELADLVEESRL